MGHYYFHDGERIVAAGYCQDGDEVIQPLPSSKCQLVLGKPPCSPSDLGIDEYWSVSQNKPVKIKKPTEILLREIRYKRDNLLKDCDWVTLRANETGVPVSYDWLLYRQALRDITTQEDLENIIWPIEPRK